MYDNLRGRRPANVHKYKHEPCSGMSRICYRHRNKFVVMIPEIVWLSSTLIIDLRFCKLVAIYIFLKKNHNKKYARTALLWLSVWLNGRY